MYKNPKQYMKDFQLMQQKTISDNHNYSCKSDMSYKSDMTYKSDIVIMERSIYSGQYIFTKMAYEDHNLNFQEYNELTYSFDKIEENINKPEFIIYLRSDPNICYDRLMKQNREEENSVTLEYLKRVHEYHEQLFISNQQYLPCAVIILNVDGKESNNVVAEKFINMINKLMYKNCSSCKTLNSKINFIKININV
jgi:deoxyadenosine/deoxycytidine kinase